jgi:hypothetical protein
LARAIHLVYSEVHPKILSVVFCFCCDFCCDFCVVWVVWVKRAGLCFYFFYRASHFDRRVFPFSPIYFGFLLGQELPAQWPVPGWQWNAGWCLLEQQTSLGMRSNGSAADPANRFPRHQALLQNEEPLETSVVLELLAQ